MFPNFYEISQENFEMNLKYFYAINQRIKNSHQCLFKFKEYTNDYCSKISQIFKETNSSLEDYEIINSDYLFINGNKDIKNNSDENLFFFPIEKSTEKLHNFLNNLVNYLTEFLKSLDNPINGIEQYVTITKNEINSIKANYEEKKNIFKSKFAEYQIINNELKNKYYEAEKYLIEFCCERREDGIAYENNYNISFANLVEEQNQLIDKYNILGNFEKIFIDCTKEKIEQIQQFTSTLILKFDNISNNIQNIFNITVIIPMNKLIDEKTKNEQDKDFETKLKNCFNLLLNNYISKIDEKTLKLQLEEYNITVLGNNNVTKEVNSEEKKLKKNKQNKKEKNETLTLNDNEIFFIVQNMYKEYKLINKKKYDLDLEEKKLELNPLITKLINYSPKLSKSNDSEENKDGEEKKDDESHEDTEKNEITKEDIYYLIKEMANENSRKCFLLIINNYRASGNLEMPEKKYDYFAKIFSEISKYLYSSEEGEEKKEGIKDYTCSKLTIILSQTFYKLKDNEKVYLSDELKKEKVFHNHKFWEELICKMINNEIDNVLENQKDLNPIKDEEKIKKLKNEVYFAQIVTLIGSMNGLGITNEEIKEIVSNLFKEYDVNEETSTNILNTMD